jgi:hypothetical protein
MTVLSTLAVILALLAGIVNFGAGLMRRKYPLMAVMRFGLCVLSIAAAVTIIIAKADSVSLASLGVSTSLKYIYLIMGLAIFVGLTLMVPASVERNNLPAEERLAPSANRPMPPTSPSATPGEGGVRMAKTNDEWVN